MGEAKRRRDKIANGPCRCGSERPAHQCCLSKNGWFKAPALIDLCAQGQTGSHPKCYLNGVNSCADKISGEHIISEAVLRVVAPTKLVASGFHWLKGEERAIGFSRLTSNCLCQTHNCALSQLDTAAARCFQAIKCCDLERAGEGKRYLFSGHDIERWMLKTLANMVASKSVARGANRITSVFHRKVDVAELLHNPRAWLPTTGLYFTPCLTEQILRDDHFWLEPMSIKEPAEVVGMKASIQGLGFCFLVVPPDAVQGTEVVRWNFRPRKFSFVHGHMRNIIEFSWSDKVGHTDVELTFTSTVGDWLATGNPLPPGSVRHPDEFRH
jgi:hypothetical protein